jgi:phosphotransacetylase
VKCSFSFVCPVVLTSGGASTEEKFNSILLAAAAALAVSKRWSPYF